MAAGFVKIAMDEFHSHHPTNNYTGLAQRYWSLVDEELAGIYQIYITISDSKYH